MCMMVSLRILYSYRALAMSLLRNERTNTLKGRCSQTHLRYQPWMIRPWSAPWWKYFSVLRVHTNFAYKYTINAICIAGACLRMHNGPKTGIIMRLRGFGSLVTIMNMWQTISTKVMSSVHNHNDMPFETCVSSRCVSLKLPNHPAL